MRLTRPPLKTWLESDRAWVALTTVMAFLIFLSTLQWEINGSQSPYATDVGEIQNALPRWGTIHFTGYPLYTFTGSLFVTALRALGVQPAAGASLFSALWGAVALGLLALLALDLDVPGPAAALSSLVVALSASTWIDASLAEVHTMSMAFTLATLLLALRFAQAAPGQGRSGSRGDLLGLTLAFTQGVAHQRAIAFLAPAVVVLIWPRLRAVWRNPWPVLGVAMLAPLTYLYLPLRAWQGAKWTFGQPDTWRGFWTMVFDTKASRIIALPTDPGQWLVRAGATVGLLNDDLPVLLVAIGLAGLLLPALHGRRRESLGLLLAVVPYLTLCLVIWEGRVSDALLAVKLPVIHLAGLGLALAVGGVSRQWPRFGIGATATLALACAALFVIHRPAVLAITRDPGAESVIATVEQVAPPDRPTTFMTLWGHDFWALAYVQAYRHQLPGLNLVDHNADFQAILGRGDRLLTLEKTFYQRPLSWWDERVGPVHLSSVAPGVIEIARTPPLTLADVPAGPHLDLGNGIRVLSARLGSSRLDELTLTVYWQAERALDGDYSVAVHLLAHDPPRGPDDILAQADRQHPVGGWYPTSRWQAGEIVRDDYVIPVSAGTQPVAVRVSMYQVDPQGQFHNTEWLVLPVPSAREHVSG